MSVPQKQLLEALNRECQVLGKRFPDYPSALLDVLGSIVILEARHKVTPLNINHEIQRKIEALGDLIRRSTKTP